METNSPKVENNYIFCIQYIPASYPFDGPSQEAFHPFFNNFHFLLGDQLAGDLALHLLHPVQGDNLVIDSSYLLAKYLELRMVLINIITSNIVTFSSLMSCVFGICSMDFKSFIKQM